MMEVDVPDGGQQAFYGLYPAIVTDIVDPERLGRIEVRLPWLGGSGEDVRIWATLLTPYADNDQGFLVLPERDTQVMIGFEAGNPRRPYIIGACWNGEEALPEAPQAANNKRLIRTRAGSLLEFDDSAGAAKVTLSTSGGHELVLDESARTVTVTHLNGAVVRITAAGGIEITANSTVDITASLVNVKAPMAKFDGVVKCETMIASTAVVSPAYTPGAGNVW